MKRLPIVLSSLSLIISTFIAIKVFVKTDKDAYVDNIKMVAKYQGLIDVRNEIENKSKVLQANVDTLVAEFENEMKNYEKERMAMTERERKLKEELLNNKKSQLDQYTNAVRDKLKEESSKLSGVALGKLNSFIK